MGFLESRLFRLHRKSKTIEELNEQIDDLRHILRSAVQDIAVLVSALQEKGVIDDAAYKRLRIAQMLRDHSSAGTSPWRYHSLYPHTLDEQDFLRQRFGAGEGEVREFSERANRSETML